MQQDNDPKHISKSSTERLKKKRLQYLVKVQTSAQIKMLLLLLYKPYHTNFSKLKQYWKEKWTKIHPQWCETDKIIQRTISWWSYTHCFCRLGKELIIFYYVLVWKTLEVKEGFESWWKKNQVQLYRFLCSSLVIFIFAWIHQLNVVSITLQSKSFFLIQQALYLWHLSLIKIHLYVHV